MGGICSSLRGGDRTDDPPSHPLQDLPPGHPGGTAPLPLGVGQAGRPPEGEASEFHDLAQTHSEGSAPSAAGSSSHPTPSQLPPLNTSMLFDNPRLRPSTPDHFSPETPPSSVMRKYADPDNLPGPDGVTNHDGLEWTKFGRSEVPTASVEAHQEVRRYWAKTVPGPYGDKPVKYLAHTEQGPGMPIHIIPYHADGARNALSKAPGALPVPDEVDFRSTVDRDGRIQPSVYTNAFSTQMRYPVNQGMQAPNGGTLSAANIAVHEGMHAAQVKVSPSGKFNFYPNETLKDYDAKGLGRWSNVKEKAAITKGNNVAALAHGETGRRDDHMTGVPFETASVTSTEPVRPNLLDQNTVFKQQWDTADRLQIDMAKPDMTNPEVARALENKDFINRAGTQFNQKFDQVSGLDKPGSAEKLDPQDS